MLITYVRKYNENMMSRQAKNFLGETNLKINTTLNKSKDNGQQPTSTFKWVCKMYTLLHTLKALMTQQF